MSWHDLVSAKTAKVCITRLATLNATAYTVYVQQLMSLPAVSLGDWVRVCRKGGTGGGGLDQRVKKAWPCVHLAVNPSVWSLHNGHLTSQGLKADFKYDLLSTAG